MTRRRRERGQAIVLVAISMTVILGFAALAIDVGIWIHAERQLQSSVDSGALAGAQDLPAAGGSVTDAHTTALNTITVNTRNNPDAGASAPTVTFPTPTTPSACSTNNCLAVDATVQEKGIIANLLSAVFGSATVHVHAQTFLGPPSAAGNVSAAPIYIDDACQPAKGCTLPHDVTLTFNPKSPLLDLNTHSATDPTITGKTNGTSTMNTWITQGYPGALPVDEWYAVDPGGHKGAKQGFKYDMTHGTVILVPVYTHTYPKNAAPRNITAYYIVGFAALRITALTWNGNTDSLQGQLVNYIAIGLTGGPGTGTNLGVYIVGIDG